MKNPNHLTIGFIDTETTGLDPEQHEIWEVALILREYIVIKHPDAWEQTERSYTWFLPVDLSKADPYALTVGKFYERHPLFQAKLGPDDPTTTRLDQFAKLFSKLTHGVHLIGAITGFDVERLARLLRANGGCPGWHYHVLCIESMVLGWLHGQENQPDIGFPWKGEELVKATGVNPDLFKKHTALGDAEMVRQVYDKITQNASSA